MTIDEFKYLMQKILDSGNCPTFECPTCKDKLSVVEGEINTIYRRYLKGCYICKCPFNKIYGIEQPEL